MPPPTNRKGSGEFARHDPKRAIAKLIGRGRQTAAVHAKRPSAAAQAHLRASLRGSGATAKHHGTDLND